VGANKVNFVSFASRAVASSEAYDECLQHLVIGTVNDKIDNRLRLRLRNCNHARNDEYKAYAGHIQNSQASLQLAESRPTGRDLRNDSCSFLATVQLVRSPSRNMKHSGGFMFRTSYMYEAFLEKFHVLPEHSKSRQLFMFWKA